MEGIWDAGPPPSTREADWSEGDGGGGGGDSSEGFHLEDWHSAGLLSEGESDSDGDEPMADAAAAGEAPETCVVMYGMWCSCSCHRIYGPIFPEHGLPKPGPCISTKGYKEASLYPPVSASHAAAHRQGPSWRGSWQPASVAWGGARLLASLKHCSRRMRHVRAPGGPAGALAGNAAGGIPAGAAPGQRDYRRSTEGRNRCGPPPAQGAAGTCRDVSRLFEAPGD